jgi:hypothetical protein
VQAPRTTHQEAARTSTYSIIVVVCCIAVRRMHAR